MEILQEADKVRSGTVDINKFMTAIINVDSVNDKEQIKQYFKKLPAAQKGDNTKCLKICEQLMAERTKRIDKIK